MKVIKESLNGIKLIAPFRHSDERGALIKTYHDQALHNLDINFEPKEEYFSISSKDVIRGMHFQIPPYEHDKMVYCIHGRIIDVVVDLRVSSETYGKYVSFELTQFNNNIIYIPSGFAHGFVSLVDESVIVCKSNKIYAPDYDAGIRWDSFNFNWPCAFPIISYKDKNLQPLSSFQSPF